MSNDEPFNPTGPCKARRRALVSRGFKPDAYLVDYFVGGRLANTKVNPRLQPVCRYGDHLLLGRGRYIPAHSEMTFVSTAFLPIRTEMDPTSSIALTDDELRDALRHTVRLTDLPDRSVSDVPRQPGDVNERNPSDHPIPFLSSEASEPAERDHPTSPWTAFVDDLATGFRQLVDDPEGAWWMEVTGGRAGSRYLLIGRAFLPRHVFRVWLTATDADAVDTLEPHGWELRWSNEQRWSALRYWRLPVDADAVAIELMGTLLDAFPAADPSESSVEVTGSQTESLLREEAVLRNFLKDPDPSLPVHRAADEAVAAAVARLRSGEVITLAGSFRANVIAVALDRAAGELIANTVPLSDLPFEERPKSSAARLLPGMGWWLDGGASWWVRGRGKSEPWFRSWSADTSSDEIGRELIAVLHEVFGVNGLMVIVSSRTGLVETALIGP